LKNTYIEKREENTDSDEEVDKLQHIMKIYDPQKLEETNDLIENSSLNTRDKLIASFYLLMPARRLEYRFLKLIKDGYDIEKLPISYNYIVIDENDIPIEILFKKYKTARAGGKIKKEIYSTQKYELNKYIIKYLINYINEEGIKINTMLFNIPLSTFSKLVGDIMNNLFQYQKINNRTIRKITAIYNIQNDTKSLKEKKKTSNQMGHSFEENSLYNKIVKKVS